MFGFVRKLGRRPAAPPRTVAYRPRDCHAHVLWGLDDGARTRDEALAMLGLLRDDGARVVAATSHIHADRFPNTPERLRRAFDDLCRARDAARIDLELWLGAEYFLDEAFVDAARSGELLAFGPDRYVLFEAPTGPTVPVLLDEAVLALSRRPVTPLLAHVERYRWARTDEGWEVLEDLRAAGVRFQVNRTVGRVNVPGVGGRGRMIERLLDRGWIDEVGSDLHRPTADGRPDPHPVPAPATLPAPGAP